MTPSRRCWRRWELVIGAELFARRPEPRHMLRCTQGHSSAGWPPLSGLIPIQPLNQRV
jgi:hypothetical protein